MAIERFFTTSMTLKRKVRTKSSSGVYKETFGDTAVISGSFDKNVTQYTYLFDKETFNVSAVAEMPADTDILEDDIVTIGTVGYNVISVINNLQRDHHLEVLLERRE